MSQPRKIAVVGARGTNWQGEDALVRWFGWDELRNVNNLSDYDSIVLSLLSTPRHVIVELPVFNRLLNPMTMRDVLGHDGRIVVVGDPRNFVSTKMEDGSEFGTPFLDWTGLRFQWDDRTGETVEDAFQYPGDQQTYGGYLAHLRDWQYALLDVEPDSMRLGAAFSDLLRLKQVKPFALTNNFLVNRYGGALSFEVSLAFGFEDATSKPSRINSLLRLAPLVFLPETTLPETEALTTILRDVCGVDVEEPEPEWVQAVIAPGQEPIDDELRRIREEVDRLIESHDAKLEERSKVRRPLRLLYDMGATLEDVVRETMRALGARVDEPDTPGKEDGWVMVEVDGETRYGVLEIKGTRNSQVGGGGLGQLSQWQHRGREIRDQQCKGIYVGNSTVETPPDERPNPFSSSFVKTATLQEVVALRSEDLYLAYHLDTLGLLDRVAFWRDLFATDGVFDIAPFRQLLDGATAA